MKIPKILFSKWSKWSDRVDLDDIDYSGVYILAKFKVAPKTNADPKDKNIIYIGETCGNSLRGRWRQFNRSAFQPKDGHSGGKTYYDTFKDSGDDLFVAAMPVLDLAENIEHLFIRYVKRKLIFEFAIENGSQPRLNKK